MAGVGNLGFMKSNALDDLYSAVPLTQDQGIFSLGNFSAATPAAPAASASKGWNWFSSKGADGTTTPGMLDYGIGALSGLGNLFMGMQNYGLAKDQLKFQKDAYTKNYAAQKQTTNASLEDRQRARVASNPTAYQSVSDYMAKNRIV